MQASQIWGQAQAQLVLLRLIKLEPRSHNEVSSRVSRGIWGQAKEVAIAKCNKETYVTFAFSLTKLEP